MSETYSPRATYRLQFNPSFGFNDASAILDYLQQLGVSDIYASPIFRARQGSMHGYDIVDPSQLNPELGTPQEFHTLNDSARQRGIGWIQDIVPNHMAYHPENLWLMDVLESGQNSEYISFFDIEWDHPLANLRGRVLVPLLGSFYSEVLERGELKLILNEQGLQVAYYDQRFPLRVESYADILNRGHQLLAQELGEDNPEHIKFLGLLYLIQSLPPLDPEGHRGHQLRFIKSVLWELYTGNETIRRHVDAILNTINGTPGQPESFNALERILAEQHFRLSYWKVATEEINYRRFFTVNELISVRVEHENVFNKTHALIAELLKQGKFNGLRIDHLDGLFDPETYLNRLRQLAPHAYLSVEKILEMDEKLPDRFPIQGTTGYTFLNFVNNLFVQNKSAGTFERIYRQFTQLEEPYEEILLARKRFALKKRLSGDIARLAVSMKTISNRFRFGSDITLSGLQFSIVEIIAFLHVYRTYINSETIDPADVEHVRKAAELARQHNPEYSREISFVEKFLLLELPHLAGEDKETCLEAIKRFQQITGPVMAKGVEDNFLYLYNNFLSLNEVGGNPKQFGITPEKFHNHNRREREHWPFTLNATATHDTKRGEDARARLNVLSEFPAVYRRLIRHWQQSNRKYKQTVNGLPAPGANAEYFLYQAILGSMPFGGAQEENFVPRLKDYVVKAMREANQRTSWINVNGDYENACHQFIDSIFDENANPDFWKTFTPFCQKLAFFGVLNSLSQKLLTLTAPGIPDIYQGTELWDFSFVDPDNRRPVNFEQRRQWLHELDGHNDPAALCAELLASHTDGKIKLFLVSRILRFRKEYPHLFAQGDYIPLKFSGKYASHLVGFARRHEGHWILAIVPRFVSQLTSEGTFSLGDIWDNTTLELNTNAPGKWENLFTRQFLHGERKLPVADILRDFPTALLTSRL